jgi:hypothetical protein
MASSGAAAQAVKCVDAKGHVRYIDQSTMGQEKCVPVTATTNTVSTQQNSAAAPPPPRGASPTATTVRNEAAIKAAEAKLETAKKILAEQEAVRTGDERNYQRVLERLKPYQDAVSQAQKELDAARQAAR